MPELILGVVALGWIVLRTLAPARWQDFGIVGAIVLAVVPTLMGLRQDPMVHTVILPFGGGLVLGDVLHRVVLWIIVKVKSFVAMTTRPRTPAATAAPRRRRSQTPK